jgi:putative ABC transport system permease protein
MMSDYVRLAMRNVRQRKLRSWLTMIGIFIGIAAVVSLLSLSQGLKSAINEQFVSLGADKLVVQAAGSGFGPPGSGVPVNLEESDKNVISKVKGVDLALGRLVRIVELEFKDDKKYTYAISFPEGSDEQDLVVEANNYELEIGSLPEKGSKEVLVGYNILVDFFEDEVELRSKILVQGEEFKVVGILKKSGNPQQDGTFVIPEESLREILDIPSAFDVIPLRVETGEDINVVAENVKKDLRKHRNVKEGKEDFVVETPEQIIGVLNNIFAIVQGVLVGIAGISLLVGGVGIMNTMYTVVLERTKEIGILKAVGASPRKILWLFVIESGILGISGGIIGIIIGFSISKFVEVVATQIFGTVLIQAEFSPFLIFGSLTFAFVVGSFSGFLPALQASRLTPVEAFRK